MEKQNKYLELKSKVKEIYKSKKLDSNTKKLFEQVLTLLEVDKLNKLSKYTVYNSEPARMLDIINQSIAGYRINLDNIIDGDHKIIYISEYVDIKNRIEKLTELRNELEEYCVHQTEPFDDKYEELLSELNEYLIGNSATLLFDRLLALPEEDAYKLLENKDIHIDLKRCINLEREKKKSIKIMELCEDILSYRNLIRENVDILTEYNNLNFEIVDKVGEEPLEELIKQKERLAECNKKLLSSGLSNLLFGLNTNLRLALNRSNTPLDMYLQDVRNENDLIDYFISVRDLGERISKYMNGSFVFEEMYLNNTANSAALEIVKNDLETAKTLVSLAEEDGTPSLRTLLVETVLAMKRTSIKDMNIDEREFIGMNKHLNKKSQEMAEEFLDRYNNIMNNDTKEKVNTK